VNDQNQKGITERDSVSQNPVVAFNASVEELQNLAGAADIKVPTGKTFCSILQLFCVVQFISFYICNRLQIISCVCLHLSGFWLLIVVSSIFQGLEDIMDKAVDLENAKKIKKYVQFSDNFFLQLLLV